MFLTLVFFFFFFNDTATTEIYTLSLHDALPIFVLLSALWISMHVNDRRAGQFSLELDYTGERGQVHRVIGFFGRVSLFDSGFTNRYQKATEDKGSRRHALQLSASRDWNLFAWDS